MSTVFGQRVDTRLEGGKIIDEHLINARSERQAKRRTKANMRLRGKTSVEFASVEEAEGENEYRVVTEAPR